MPHLAEIPVLVFVEFSSLEDEELSDSNDADFESEDKSACKKFDQLNDLTQDLGLSKIASELSASRQNEKNLLENGTKVYF